MDGLSLLYVLVLLALLGFFLLWRFRDVAYTPWRCPTCGCRFARVAELDVHELTHTPADRMRRAS